MDSLYNADKLNPSNKVIYEKYRAANNALQSFTKTDIRTLNFLTFEHLNKYRQFLQHHEIPKI